MRNKSEARLKGMPQGKRLLNIPYLSQIDNMYHPRGTCNITALAMCMSLHGIVGDGTTKQLEDQLYLKARKEQWDVTYPDTIKKLAEWKGLEDDFTYRGNLATIVDSIDRGFPIIAHGYFTKVGHIVVVVGYDKPASRVIYHDPYGEWFHTGYEINDSTNRVRGMNNEMSFGTWQSVVSPEGKDYGWYHVIKPPTKRR